jgi:hypothetical protein
VFNTLIQSLFWAWSLPSTLEKSKNHNSAEAQQGPRIFPELMSDQPLVHYGKTIWEAEFKNDPKTLRGKNY